MKRLTGLDATFLYMETPSNLMHVASVAVFDPTTVPGGYAFSKVRNLVEDRLALLPPFRWRLVEVPFQLTHPVWIEDPDFDLDYHVRRAALPAPGGDAELAEFAADVFGRPLDRSRPLWEMYVVEGLEGGLIAVVTKTHHAAIDGVSICSTWAPSRPRRRPRSTSGGPSPSPPTPSWSRLRWWTWPASRWRRSRR